MTAAALFACAAASVAEAQQAPAQSAPGAAGHAPRRHKPRAHKPAPLQPAPAAQSGAPASPPPAADAPPQEQIDVKRGELRGVEDSLGLSDAQKRKLEEEVATLRTDRARLAENLMEAAERLRAAEDSAHEAETRLAELTGKEEGLVASLQERRDKIVEVLVVLQRMGRRPPPALLVRPEDILEAIRASIALGAVLPEMRAEALKLQTDLSELVRLRDDIRAQQSALEKEKQELIERRARLQAMIDARQASLQQAEGALDKEATRARELAAKATSLKDLIGRMETESAAARAAAEAARRAEAERQAAETARTEEERARALKDPARLAPAVAFAELKGRLPLPANGAIIKRFGAPDGAGGAEKGVSIATRANGVVVAPSDGWAAFSGPYRGYGQLLIINAGGGYYVVLAGMSRINVNVGQFILAGEPVASMGDGAAVTAATIAIGGKEPILYVEFRKDGSSIDPSPWWAKTDKTDMRKVGG